MMKFIGVGGQMQNGKDTIADHLAKMIDWERIAFAYDVKRIFCEAFDVDMAFVEKWKVIPEPPPGFKMSVRKSLQLIGDGFRSIHDDVWINLTFKKENKTAIVSDIRYINELKSIKERGGVTVLVWRKGKENDDPNGSEAQLKPMINWFVNTGLEGDVIAQMRKMNALVNPPIGAEYVDLFIRNEGTQKELIVKVEDVVEPYVRKYYGL